MIRNFHQSKRKKIRGRPSDNFDHLPEVGREIERQAQEKQEIENRRKKRKLIFWTIVIFGTVIAAAISIVFLSLLGSVEW